MTIVDQYNTTQPIPLVVVANAGDFKGVAGAKPSVRLSKNGGALEPAQGEIADLGSGVYWLQPNSQDANTPGTVLIVITAPSGDIAPIQAFYVRQPSIWQQLAAAPANLASLAANIRLLTRYTIPATQQGQIQ